ncbi:MAG: hypothetical protein RLY61_575 [Candidatus Parcubacteria bacterium]|jgi:glycosyltransferase involved in cell wall biosynthesis
MKPLTVTFCVPTYNRLTFLKKTLESILKLEGISDWDYKIIVSDDSTNEDTAEYIKSLKSDRLIYVKNPNKGQFENINHIFSLELGELAVIVHDDDLLEQNYLTYLQLLYTKHTDAYVMYSSRNTIDVEGNALSTVSPVSEPIVIASGATLADYTGFGNCPPQYPFVVLPMVTGLAFRPSLLKKVGEVDTSLYVNADSLLLIKLLFYSAKVMYVRNPLVSYRVLDISERSRPAKDGKVFSEMEKLLLKMLEFYKENIPEQEYDHFARRKEAEFVEFNSTINAPLLWTALRYTGGYANRVVIQVSIFSYVVSRAPRLLITSPVVLLLLISLFPQSVLNYLYKVYMKCS